MDVEIIVYKVVEIIVYKLIVNNFIKSIRVATLMLLIFIIQGHVVSQCNDQTSAYIYTKKGKPLYYASIFSQQRNTGTYSNSNGEFTVKHCENDTLIISYLNYKKTSISSRFLSNNDTVFLERSSVPIPEVNISPKAYYSKLVKPQGDMHGSYSSDVGMTFAVHINNHSGSYLEEITFYFQTRIEDSIFKLVIIPFSENLSKETSILDSVIFIQQNNFFSRKATINISSFGIQIPRRGVLVGLEKVRLPKKVNAFQLIDSDIYNTWVGKWGRRWYNYSISPLVKAKLIGSTMKIQYKILIPKEE